MTFCAQHIIFFFYQNINERVQWELSHSPQNCYQGKISGAREQWKNTSAGKAGVFWLCVSPFMHQSNA